MFKLLVISKFWQKLACDSIFLCSYQDCTFPPYQNALFVFIITMRRLS